MSQHHQRAMLRVVSYLSPLLDDLYQSLATYVGEQIGIPVHFSTGQSLEDFTSGRADMGFLSGLISAQIEHLPLCPIELVAAPVLQGVRYRGTPLSFADVIVRSDSSYTSLLDLRGSVWAYTETPFSSGYHLVRQRLAQRGFPSDYFRWVIATNSQLQSVQAILHGHADATAVDSHVLAIFLQKEPERLAALRVIDTFGPPQVTPVVLSKALAPSLRQCIQEALLSIHLTPQGTRLLQAGLLERFLPLGHENEPHVSSLPLFSPAQPCARS